LFSSASNSTVLYFGSGSNKLNGHIQEIRLWSGSLNDSSIQEHAASPSTYTFNVDRYATATGDEALASYNNLINRYSLLSNQVYSGSVYINSIHPNQSLYQNKLYFNGYVTQSTDYIKTNAFEGFEETYYLPTPSLGNTSLYSNKVRIESSSLNGTLNTKTRVEASSYDKFSSDSNRLGIYFSPQNAINEDIFNQLGYFEIDDYIGNPSDIFNDNYPVLKSFSSKYWKKYNTKNDFEAYFRSLVDYDFTLFEYIKRLVPLRTNLISGLVIEPNVLERNKVRSLGKASIQNLYHTSSINVDDTTIVTGVDETLPMAQMSGSTATFNAEYRQVSPGLIESIGEDINILTGTWSQTRQIGAFTIKESGSYVPIQKLILNSRPSVELLVPSTDLSDIFGNALNFDNADPAFYFNTVAAVGSNITYTYGTVPGGDQGVTYSTNTDITNKGKIAAPGGSGVPGFVTSSCLWISGSIGPGSGKFVNIFIPSLNNIYQNINVSFAVRDKTGLGLPTTTALTLYAAGTNRILHETSTSTVGSFVTYNYTAVPNINGINLSIVINGISSFDLFVDNISVIGTYKKSDIQDFEKGSMQHISLKNQTYAGSKLTGPAVNVNSAATVDGGPVVKVTKVNPNQLTFADKQITTIDQTVTGQKIKKVGGSNTNV
jgi:hypothetical protein